MSFLQDVEVKVTVELGGASLSLAEVAALRPGVKMRIDRAAEDPVDIRVNGRLFGRGRLVVVGDHYGVELLEVVGG